MTAEQQTDTWTTMRLLQWTTDFFKRRKFDSPRLDAEVLLATAVGCKRIELYTAFDKIPDDNSREAYRELVRRRGEGVPVAYLVGHKEFYSLDLMVNESVLIPRPETEHLVVEVLDRAKKLGEKPTILIADVGTGSGAIAIAVAKHQLKARVLAIDVSPQALEVAAKNVEQYQLSERVKLIEGDLFASVDGKISFDLIASNPPYISESEYSQLSKEVRGHEPRAALLAGPTGTEVIARLVKQSESRLVAGGRLVIELSPMIAASVRELFAGSDAWYDLQVIKDIAGHARILSAARR